MAPLGAFPCDYCQRHGSLQCVPVCAAIALNLEEKNIFQMLLSGRMTEAIEETGRFLPPHCLRLIAVAVFLQNLASAQSSSVCFHKLVTSVSGNSKKASCLSLSEP